VVREDQAKVSLEPRTELVQAEVIKPPANVVRHLGLSDGDQTLIRKRHMFADERPVQIAASYIPLSIAGSVDLPFPDTGPTGIYERLAERGHRVVRFAEEIESRRPSPDEAEFLRIPQAHHVLEVVRFAYDRLGRPLEVVMNVFPSQLWRLTYEWTAE
jgi:GntR family transcriptional regulator